MWSVAIVAAGALGAPALSAQVPAAAPAASDSAGLVEVAAMHARQTAQHLEEQSAPRGRVARPDPGAASYLKGLAWLARDQNDSAEAALRAAITSSPNVARYHGDLAFTLTATGRWSDAEDEYRAAVRLQQANAWYFVELGAVQLAQQHWAQAAASFTLAVQVDSGVIVRQLIDPATQAFMHAGMAEALDDWAHMATTRFPSEPTPWLRLASVSYEHQDTVVGFPAIRHYRSLRPDDRVGALVYAEYMLNAGQYDSAATLAHQASPDSALQHLSVVVMYNAGGHLLQDGKFPRAAEVLQQARDLAPPADQPRIDLFLGVAKFRVLQPFYNDAVEHSDCHKSHAADSMLTDVAHLITSGIAADSALANQILAGAVVQYRTSIDGFVKQCANRH